MIYLPKHSLAFTSLDFSHPTLPILENLPLSLSLSVAVEKDNKSSTRISASVLSETLFRGEGRGKTFQKGFRGSIAQASGLRVSSATTKANHDY